jgi:hypothetical protein
VYKYESGSWTTLLSTPDITQWISVDGYVGGSQHVLFIGSWRGKQNGSMYESIMKSTDSGNTWTPMTVDASKIHFTMGGSGGDLWFLSEENPDAMLGSERYVANQIVINPADTQDIYVSGRSGVWRSTNGGMDWYPMVRGMNVTFNRDITHDPNAPWKVYTATTDWNFLYSTDSLNHVAGNNPGGEINGKAVTVDPFDSKVYLAIGNKSENIYGDVVSNANPANGGIWSSEGLSAHTTKRPIGVAVKNTESNFRIIAAVDDAGIWRKSGGSWSQVLNPSEGLGTQTTKTATISWVGKYVYVYDRETGIWRSDSNGAANSWTKIWSKPTLDSTLIDSTGYLAADPGDADIVYVSAEDGLYRLNGAKMGTVGNGITTTLIAVPNPGPITVDSDRILYATSRMTSTTAAGLYKYDNSTGTLTNIADDYYKYNAGFPMAITAVANGKVFVTLSGQGVMVGSP